MHDIPTKLFVDLPQCRSHLLDWGGPSDTPTILLIHGLNLTSNAKIWNYVAPILAQNFRVLALDQRSHGLTSKPTDNDFGFAALCDDLDQICEHLGIGRRIVVGHSWGADITLNYAATRHDHNLLGAIMIDGAFVGLNKVMTWPEAEKIPNLLQKGTSLIELQKQAKHWLGEYYNPEIFKLILGNFEVNDDETITPHLAFDSAVKIWKAQWEQNAESLYSEVKCPALFLPCLSPEPLDAFNQQFLAWKRMKQPQIQSLIPQVKIDWLEDSIHDVPLQRPEMLAEKIRIWIKSIS